MHEWFSDLSRWGWLVISGWRQYAEAGSTALVWVLIEKLRKRPFSWKFLGWIGIVFLLFAFFNVWREQYRATNAALDSVAEEKHKTQDVQHRLDSLTQPQFELSWAAPMVGEATFVNPNGAKTSFSDFYIQIAVLNHGAPSVIKDWKGLAKLSDGTVIEGQLLTGNKKNIRIHIGKQDFPVDPQLIPIWSITPVPTGGRGVGSVIVKLPAGLKEKMEMQGAAIIVKLSDMSGKEYQIEIPWSKFAGTGLPTGLSSSLPGMEIP